MRWHKVKGALLRHFQLECGVLQLEFFLVWHRSQLGSRPRVVGRLLAGLAGGGHDFLGNGGSHLSDSLVGPDIVCAQQKDMQCHILVVTIPSLL